MANKDERDLLNLLQEELSFIESGGYGRSVRTPWLPKSIFQDSLSCLNYGDSHRTHPCAECHLLDFVAPEHKSEAVPCHHISLDQAGSTIEDLEVADNESKTQQLVKEWLRARIKELETTMPLSHPT
jgi:hypothetical protein